ncbi:fumarylacetoacetase [Thermaurantimonas aggregans]|uniref:fumarylacetoacetase n=1 Tax=Thermaurantimonas aggregans TaxID=2173829 RepID=A0A401XNR4_9FLAO|nr:fumarylacetoacetase [Thermaurantimonas aggregans]MCX8147674.1 fumarylacetoacetase [Thermaurantimonas aggregans]GCD78640.1 fumarylacetoacetase [Thermaurantimonas aggregans]
MHIREVKNLKSWIEVSPKHPFPVYNLPYGIGLFEDGTHSAVTRIGDFIINLSLLFQSGLLRADGLTLKHLAAEYLNDYIALPKATHLAVRERLIELFTDTHAGLYKLDEELKNSILVPHEKVKMLLPVKPGDYTDFYSSKEHATNVGIMFRGPENALMPNWLHMPIAYHGRSSSIVVSGTDLHRPWGQIVPPNAENPIFSPSKQLDFELEVAFVTRSGKPLGQPIKVDEAEEYIFGLVLFNDWSARDIQKWEYQPLGPFLGKNFGSTISPWIVTLEALEPFRCAGPTPEKELLPYLQTSGEKTFDIHLEVDIAPSDGKPTTVCRSNFKYLYWNMSQQLAHHTVNGCNIQAGDMMASGTISGPTPDSFGSMLELAWKGTKPVKLEDGSERTFILDGDTIIIRGYCEREDLYIGFGEATTTILPAIDY